jgi:hypothetical protein
MTNPLNRGSAPGRARDASERPGSFKPGHAKVGGRKKGTPNAMSSDYVTAVFEAAQRAGSDGIGKDGIVGYFKLLLIKCPRVAVIFLTRLMELEGWCWPEDEPLPTMEEFNQRTRSYLESRKRGGPAAPTEWPVTDLMRIAVKYPETFANLLIAMLPRPPTAQLRRKLAGER